MSTLQEQGDAAPSDLSGAGPSSGPHRSSVAPADDSADEPRLEELIGLAELAAHVPGRRPGRKLHRSTLFRWASKGVRPHAGAPLVRLRTWRLGGRLVSTETELRRFMERLDAASGEQDDRPVTPASERRRLEQVSREEAEAGA